MEKYYCEDCDLEIDKCDLLILDQSAQMGEDNVLVAHCPNCGSYENLEEK